VTLCHANANAIINFYSENVGKCQGGKVDRDCNCHCLKKEKKEEYFPDERTRYPRIKTAYDCTLFLFCFM